MLRCFLCHICNGSFSQSFVFEPSPPAQHFKLQTYMRLLRSINTCNAIFCDRINCAYANGASFCWPGLFFLRALRSSTLPKLYTIVVLGPCGQWFGVCIVGQVLLSSPTSFCHVLVCERFYHVLIGLRHRPSTIAHSCVPFASTIAHSRSTTGPPH